MQLRPRLPNISPASCSINRAGWRSLTTAGAEPIEVGEDFRRNAIVNLNLGAQYVINPRYTVQAGRPTPTPRPKPRKKPTK